MADKDSINNRTSSKQGGGLFGKVLLPGYADAGASTAFQTLRHTNDIISKENEQQHDYNDVDDDDKHSEATTALHDNRTICAMNTAAASTPQQHNVIRAEFHSKYGFFPSTKPPQISPRPSSPPTVTRRQLPISNNINSKAPPNIAGTSVVPENGAIFAEQQIELSSHSRSTCTDSTGRGNRESSLMEEDGEDENDDDDRLSEVPSDILSTASEMGTVINIGSAQMAEIDAMAALVESSPVVQDDDDKDNNYPSLNQQLLEERTVLNKDLSLPVLESRPFDPTIPLSRNTLKQSTSLEKNMNFARSSRSNENFQQDQQTLLNPTTTEMMTKAIRRMGPGGFNSNNKRSSHSAPPTPNTPGVQPPRVEDLLKSTLTPRSNKQNALPASFAMRSPGSSARQAIQQTQKTTTPLTPRFSLTTSPSWLQQQQSTPRAMDYVVSDDLLIPQGSEDRQHNGAHTPRTDYSKTKQAPNATLSPHDPSLLFPVRLAQRCFSFDSTLDEFNNKIPTTAGYPNDNGDRVKILPRVEEQDRSRRQLHLHHSQSWDIGRSRPSATAFRTAPHRLLFGPVLKNTASQDDHARVRLNSDFSPTKMDPKAAIELQTPQRIEIEREDALDILSCLVERGVSDWKTTNEAFSSTTSSAGSGLSGSGDEVESSSSSTAGSMMSDSMVASAVEEFRKLSREIPVVQTDDKTVANHPKRMAALEELLKAHAYALEMKRASLSASSWLKSIGRFSGEHTETEKAEALTSSSGGQTSGEANDSNPAQPLAATKMEMITLNAKLHRAEMDLKETTEANTKLNFELSKCRAEIGRLKTTSRNEHSNAAPNRSIMDDSYEDETSSIGGSNDYRTDDKPSPIPRSDSQSRLFDESFNGNNSIFPEEETNKQQEGETGSSDVLAMKSALEKANETIRRLHKNLKKDEKGETECLPPVVDIPEAILKEPPSPQEEGVSSPTKDFHRTVNVRMLDGENFITEWDDLTPPLPPPPDHGLRSPIVYAVLEQWTNDRSLHESLIGWIERVMTGNNIDSSVPPLTISSLDHQVRDGFTMHVLPLLLRRADIHVAVQTRAHRTTKYDMAVTVSQNSHKSYQQSPGSNQQHAASLLDHYIGEEWLQDKADASRIPSSGDSTAAHSTFGASHSAVTEKAFNTGAAGGGYNVQFRDHPSEMDEYSHFGRQRSGSSEFGDEHQPGIMSALGGALGGLLSRRKFSAETSHTREGYYHNDAVRSSMPAELRAQLDLTSSPVHGSFPKEEDQPYHRVVSAPPGRIGVTFVEFRGHAMVSDVAPDGPLASWVFPSDILVAIDEVPVSGMRVRDIIKMLTSRRDHQRALRMISSHAMNEFTLNSSTLNEEQDTD